MNKEWIDIKKTGQKHYKAATIEPIDLFKAAGSLKHFAIDSIIKYAYRNTSRKIVEKDLDKIIHYARMLRVLCHEGQ